MQTRTTRWTPLGMPKARRSYVGLLRRNQRTFHAITDIDRPSPALAADRAFRELKDSAVELEQMAASATRAKLLWVTEDMTGLADRAALSLSSNPHTPIWHDQPDGICKWEKSPFQLEEIGIYRVTIDAAQWNLSSGALRLWLLARANELPMPKPRLHEPTDFWTIVDCATIDLQRTGTDNAANASELAFDAFMLLQSTLLLAEQTSHSDVTNTWADPTRPGKPPRPTPDVQVIDLRRNQRAPRESSREPRPIEHDHRWEVGHHWRTQHYGPGNSLSRLIFIDDYVQGPDDKPLRRRERVYRLCR